ncbi:MAG: hypothetical protein AAGD43_34510 [Pseudomonadota bacterium]
MINDQFDNTIDSVVAPARQCFAITPDDVEPLSVLPKALYVGTGGDLVVRSIDGMEDVTLRNVPDGSIIDIRTIAVRSSGTTATDLVGLA